MDTIYSLFQKVVKEHENAPAIIENDRAMTFGELSNMVDMITCSFPQEVHSIGIVMRHRTEMIASILAVLKCGGQYVPADRKSTRLNSSHRHTSRMPSSA